MNKINDKLKQIQTFRTQTGVTLLELMVAMAVSAVIILGISNIYLSTKKSYLIHDEFARIQENGRYSTETLSSNIRNAGYYGCSSGQGPDNIINGLKQTTEIGWNFETGIMGFEAIGTDVGATKKITPTTASNNQADWVTPAGMTSGGAALNTALDPKVLSRAVAGSDIIIIRTASGLGVRIAQNNNGTQVFLDDTTNGPVTGSCPQNNTVAGSSSNGISGICEGDILLVSNCSQSRIFQAANIQPVGGGPGACGKPGIPCFNVTHPSAGTPGNADVTWTPNTFGPNSEILKVVTRTFFIGVPLGGGEPSLYVQNNKNKPDQLVEGIENMQILYGVDTSGDGVANRYFSANNVPDVDGDPNTIFDGVVSVKLGLLTRTPQNLPGINRTVADYAKLTYAMVSPAAPITIDPIANDATSTDRRMRKMYNLTIQIRNKSLKTSN